MNQETRERAKEFIKKWEGLSLKAYYCPAGYLTIGWGHILKEGELLVIDKSTAEAYLDRDIAIRERQIKRLVRPEIQAILTPGQWVALISFVFNLGSGAFQASTLRQKLNRGDDKEEVANEFPRWAYSKGKFIRGLYLRRLEERRLFLNG